MTKARIRRRPRVPEERGRGGFAPRGDDAAGNPLYAAWLERAAHLAEAHGEPPRTARPHPRWCALCPLDDNGEDPRRRYAWAVPTAEAVAALTEFAEGRGLIEIGAGLGYWAGLLRRNGADILAYDREPEGCREYFDRDAASSGVEAGGPEMAARAGRRALFLCWPPGNEPMASEALKAYPGSLLAYAGEGRGGCTGDAMFHYLLERHWDPVGRVELPRWNPAEDSLTFWRRKRRSRTR